MNILFVLDQCDNENNGTTISARRFAEVFRARGHEVRFVSAGKDAEDKYVVKELRIPFFDGIIKKQGALIAKPDAHILRKAIAWADVVHFFLPFWLSAKGRKIAEEMGVAHTAAFHTQPENISYNFGLGESVFINRLIYKHLHKFYRHFSHIHCPSKFIATELSANGYAANLHIISNGVSGDFSYKKLAKPPSEAEVFRIVMVGRLSSEKRQDVLISAAKKAKHAERIQLVFAGKGPKQKLFEQLARDLTRPPVFQFFTQQGLLRLLAASDLYIHAADAEIEGISCIEAISIGLVPVISDSPKSAAKQFALDERSLFKRGNSDDLASKIDYWIENENERRKMERTYAEYGKQFNIAVCAKKMEAMFTEAILEQVEKAHEKQA